MDLEQAKADMMGAEAALQPYNDTTTYDKIRQGVMDQWSPTLERATSETGRMLSEFLPRYFNATNDAYVGGTTAADINPTQKLGYIGNQLGNLSGQLTQQTDYADYLGGNAQSMADKAIQAAQNSQASLASAYDRAAQRYQMLYQEEQDRLAREAAARAAAAQASQYQDYINSLGGGGVGNTGGVGASGDLEIITATDRGLKTNPINVLMGQLGSAGKDIYNNLPGAANSARSLAEMSPIYQNVVKPASGVVNQAAPFLSQYGNLMKNNYSKIGEGLNWFLKN